MSTREDAIWQSAGVRSVSEFQDFPFPNYQEFVTAVLNSNASVGIEYQGARELSFATKPPLGMLILNLMSCVPFLLLLASFIVPFFTGNWALLVGIPISLIGMMMASPHNPLHRFAYLISWVSILYCILVGTIDSIGSWSAFVFGISFLAIRVLNRTAWRWAYSAILRSEALTAVFWRTKNLHINLSRL